MTWSRHGDFSGPSIFECGCHPPIIGPHEVTFTSHHASEIIPRIDVRYEEGKDGFRGYDPERKMTVSDHGGNHIILHFSPFYTEELTQAFIDTFVNEGSRSGQGTEVSQFDENGKEVGIKSTMLGIYHLPIRLHLIPKLLELFDYFHRKYNIPPLPEELRMELINICYVTMEKNWESFKHCIPTFRPKLIRFTDADDEQDKKIIDLLYFNPAPNKALENLLLKGYNANEFNLRGATPTSLAVVNYQSTKILETLLIYGADPLSRCDNGFGGGWSAFELAKIYNMQDKLDIIISATSKIEFPVDKQLKVIHTNFLFNEKQFNSAFHFSNNKTIYTTFKSANYLRKKEREVILDQFSHIFEVPNDVEQLEIKKIFEEDFSPDKFIELIYDNDKKEPIGFLLYEILHLKKNKEHLILHCVYSYILPEYRGYGLMTLLSSRPAFSLQTLHDNKKIGIFFSSIHYNSYRTVKDFLHAPKYQADYMDELIDEILQTIFHGEKPYYFHDGITFFLLDQLKVKGPALVKPSKDIHQNFFYKRILAIENLNEEIVPTRAAPVLYFASKENFQKMCGLAKNLGTDFVKHTHEFAKFLRMAIKKNSDQKMTMVNMANLLRSDRLLFWQRQPLFIRKKKVANQSIPKANY